MSEFGGLEVELELGGQDEGTTEPTSSADIVRQLFLHTRTDFSASKIRYRQFIVNAQNAVEETPFYLQLSELHDELRGELLVGKIRAIDAWADGEKSFNLQDKPWVSVLDKLYRLNIEENDQKPEPPRVLSIAERAADQRDAGNVRWITPERAHEFADDLLRTKFVVPFVDGVVDVSQRVVDAINNCGLPWFQRYHAKDSGYHARHVYVLLPIPGFSGGDAEIALEIKILTKLQDTLGELTHLLYELKRTGKIKVEKKRKLAWQFESPDFAASYLGHSAHYLEAAMVALKTDLEQFESEDDQNADS